MTLGVAFSVGEFIIKWPMLTAASLIGSLPTIILYLTSSGTKWKAWRGGP